MAGGHQAVTFSALSYCCGARDGRSEGGALLLSLGTPEAVDVVREVQDLPTTHMAWKPRAFRPPWLWFGPQGRGITAATL